MRRRLIVRPDALDLDSPGRRDYWVALEHDTFWGDHLVPLTVMVGPQAKEGEGLVAIGGTHGNEYEGPIAIRHLLRTIDPASVRGRIILIPVLNVAAFRIGTRDSIEDDGVNLNRAFVADAGRVPALGRITHRIADFVRRLIWPRVHVVIDLHCGGMMKRFALCMSYHPVADPEQDRLIERTARWFGTPLLMTYQNETPGLLTSEAERLGKITIGSELGWGTAVQPEGVLYARHGVLAAAIHHHQLEGRIEPFGHHRAGTQVKAAIVERACYTVAPVSGHYEPLQDCGARVAEGTTVGLLHDFERIDQEPWPVTAGVEGIVVAQAWQAPVRQGEHILVVGKEQPWSDSAG
jgi:N2-acetyl-L-2,4-diaminobutanoate deacetylase